MVNNPDDSKHGRMNGLVDYFRTDGKRPSSKMQQPEARPEVAGGRADVNEAEDSFLQLQALYMNIYSPGGVTLIYIVLNTFIGFWDIERPSADAADPNPEHVTPPRPTPGDVGVFQKPTT